MTPDVVIDVFRQALYLTTTIVLLLVTPGLVVGLLIAMFQAATQINEMSMTFVPKVVATIACLAVTGPWVLNMMLEYTENLILDILNLIG